MSPNDSIDHDDRCICEYCSNELKDERSISAGYGPVCAKKRNLPWGGPGAVRRSIVTWMRETALPAARDVTHRVVRSARSRGRTLASWTQRSVAPRVRSAASWLSRSVDALMQRSPLTEIVRQRWAHLEPRHRKALMLCPAVVTIVILAVCFIGVVDEQPTPDTGRGNAMTASMPVQIKTANEPVVVHVAAGSAREISTASPSARRSLARRAAGEILPAVAAHPRQVVAIHFQDLPLCFEAMDGSQRGSLESQLGGNAAQRYESAVAAFINVLLDTVEQEHPRAVLTVLGLPVEPEEAGVSIEIVRTTNERYRDAIDRLESFVPARRFVVFGSSLDEKMLARMGMREALRLRHGRPIVFKTNVVWRALVDHDDAGRDFEIQAALVDD